MGELIKIRDMSLKYTLNQYCLYLLSHGISENLGVYKSNNNKQYNCSNKIT